MTRRVKGKLTHEVNNAKLEIQNHLDNKKQELESARFSEEINQSKLDVTLPPRGTLPGGLHPITRTLNRIEHLFERIGFDVVEGPEIEDDYHNFEALNIP